MAQASIQRIFRAPWEKVWSVLTDYESYPSFLDYLKSAKVLERKRGKVFVEYHVKLIKDISYVLELREEKKEKKIEWSLARSPWMKKNEGFWKLKAQGDQTQAKYVLDLEFTFPVPSWILKKLLSIQFPQMMDQFQRRIES